MDAFNFAFSLFAIVLGLSIAEVLTGFARGLRRWRSDRPVGLDGTSHPKVRLGWLTPLLGIFVMLDLVAFWEWGWAARRFVSPNYGILIIGLLSSGLYYLAAAMIFPAEFGGREDFDEHYAEHHRQVFGAVLVCNLIETVPIIVMRWGDMPLRTWVETGIYYAAILTGLIARGKRTGIAALLVLILLYLFSAVISFTDPVAL